VLVADDGLPLCRVRPGEAARLLAAFGHAEANAVRATDVLVRAGLGQAAGELVLVAALDSSGGPLLRLGTPGPGPA
jgi:hypothetical protein